VARILDNLTELKKLIKRKPFGLITDIDGTISRTTANLLMAKITKTNRLCLSTLSKKMALVSVISGRQSQKVKDMVNIDGVVCIGHYGMEQWEGNAPVLHPDAQPYVPYVRALVKELEVLKSVENILIQDKWAAISVIYRQSPYIEKARKAILDLLNKSSNARKLRIITEKKVFGIVPPIDIDKGTAIADLIQKYRLQGGIYLGDDAADIPAFRAIHNNTCNYRGLAIAVTCEDTPPEVITEADFTLDGVRETETLLQWLEENYI
jgi:trehalose 6-phosphate phosphatase